MITNIPLDKLVRSDRNVRRVTDADADRQLKADIAARGLLQNLVVAPASKRKRSFAVEAGDRRLRALQGLAEEGAIAAGAMIPCLVLDAGDLASREAGLAENFQRLRMNPADECLAFQQLIAQGGDVAGVARRFGLTERFVEGRLRLASLAPAIFEALGAGEISLDVAKAYAATPDAERQAVLFDQLRGGYCATSPDSIRRLMTQATVAASDRRARFVGEPDYLAGGGRIERDLFADADDARWLDVALLEKLAGEKLAAAATATAESEGLAFVRPTLDTWVGGSDLEGLRPVPLEREPLSEADAARVDALEAEIEQRAVLIDDEEADAEARDDAEAQVKAMAGEIDAILTRPPSIDAAIKSSLGTS